MWGLSAAESEALLLSLRVAAVAVLASLPLALACGWLLARRRFPGKLLLDALIHLPLVLPPVVTGYVLLRLFGQQGPIGQWLQELFGLNIAFRWTGAALACAVMGFPLMVRAIRLAIENVDLRRENAAATLGAPPWKVFATVCLPLAWPGVIAGAVLGFAKALGEFGATITFVSSIPGETRTLSAAIYALLQVPGGEDGLWRLCLAAVLLSLAALLLAEWLVQRQRAERAP
jgi:molybdate transport system permease protein